MKVRALALVSVVAATASFATACDTHGVGLGALGGKVQAIREMAQQALQGHMPPAVTQGLGQLPQGLGQLPQGLGDLASMNQQFDQQFDQTARQLSWQLAQQLPNDLPMADLASQLRANSAQAESGLDYIRGQEANSNRALQAVEDWDHQVLRNEVPVYVPNEESPVYVPSGE